MVIKVRAAEAKDYDAWLTLWKGYLAFSESENLEEEMTLSAWNRSLSPESTLMCRVAETDHQIVGFAMCVLHERTWGTQPVCYLEDLYVDEKMRGNGAGKALIEAIRDEAEANSWARVYWVTHEDNPARRLYDKQAVLEDFVRYSITIESKEHAEAEWGGNPPIFNGVEK